MVASLELSRSVRFTQRFEGRRGGSSTLLSSSLTTACTSASVEQLSRRFLRICCSVFWLSDAVVVDAIDVAVIAPPIAPAAPAPASEAASKVRRPAGVLENGQAATLSSLPGVNGSEVVGCSVCVHWYISYG